MPQHDVVDVDIADADAVDVDVDVDAADADVVGIDAHFVAVDIDVDNGDHVVHAVADDAVEELMELDIDEDTMTPCSVVAGKEIVPLLFLFHNTRETIKLLLNPFFVS